jgi:MFS family permease
MTAVDPTLTATEPAPATGQPRERLPIIGPLRIRDFRILFSGETVSVLGDQFHFIALAWLALQLTGSGFALGTVLMTAGVPRAIFMLVGGAFSDRFSPRTLMLVSNAIRAVLVAALAVMVITGVAQLWHLYVLAAAFGIVDAFFYPAMNAILPMMVDERRLPAANALMEGMRQLTGLIGPVLAGLLVQLVSTGPAFAIDAVSFAVAAGALVLVRGGRRAVHGDQLDVGGAVRDGLRYAWSDPAIRSLIFLIAAFNVAFGGPINVGLPWLAQFRFHEGPTAYGIMIAGWGAGAVLGTIAAGMLARIEHLGAVMLGLAFMLGVGLAVIGLAPSVPVAFAVLGVMGLGGGFLNVRVIAWLQARVDRSMVGRVMILVMLGSVGLVPVSYGVAGALVDVHATLMFLVAGALVVLAVIAGLLSGVPARMREEPAP